MKLSKVFVILFFTAPILFGVGCSYKKSELKTNLGIKKISQGKLESISYDQVYSGVFLPKCVSCHGNSGGVNLENYENTVSHMSKIRETALINKTMPKGRTLKLSDDEYLLLETWINAGGPLKPHNGRDTKPIPIEVLKPEFGSIKKIILERKCLSCHGTNGEAERVSLNTPEEMINSPLEIVIPGNAEESGLVLTLDSENTIKPMPPIDSGITPVTQSELETVKAWINNGAKD